MRLRLRLPLPLLLFLLFLLLIPEQRSALRSGRPALFHFAG